MEIAISLDITAAPVTGVSQAGADALLDGEAEGVAMDFTDQSAIVKE